MNGILEMANRAETPVELETNGMIGYAIGYSDWFFSEDGLSAIEIIHTWSGDFQFRLHEVNEKGNGLNVQVDCPEFWWTRVDALQAARSFTSAQFG